MPEINNPENTGTRRFNINSTNTPSFDFSACEVIRPTLLKHPTPGIYIILYSVSVATTTITCYILNYPPTREAYLVVKELQG